MRLLKGTHLDEIDVCQIGVASGPLYMHLYASVADVASSHGKQVAQSCMKQQSTVPCMRHGRRAWHACTAVKHDSLHKETVSSVPSG